MARPTGAPARLLDNDTRLRWWPSGDPRIGEPLNRTIGCNEDPSNVLETKLNELTKVTCGLVTVALAHLDSVPGEATQRSYESRLRLWVLPHFLSAKGRDLLEQGQLDPSDLERHSLPVSALGNALYEMILKAAVANGATDTTLDNLDGYLGALGTHLVNTDVCFHHPLGAKRRSILKGQKSAAKRKNTKKRRRPDVVPIWAEITDWADAAAIRLERGGHAIIVYAATGLRFAELPGLHVDDINFDTEEIYVRNQLTRHAGIVPCPKDVDHRTVRYWALANDSLRYLVDNADPHGWLFPAEGNAIWYDTLGRELNLAAKDCGFAWSIKDLRAQYATYNLAPTTHGGFGWPVSVVQEWMGHAHSSTTNAHYWRMTRQLKVNVEKTFGDIHPSQLRAGRR